MLSSINDSKEEFRSPQQDPIQPVPGNRSDL